MKVFEQLTKLDWSLRCRGNVIEVTGLWKWRGLLERLCYQRSALQQSRRLYNPVSQADC